MNGHRKTRQLVRLKELMWILYPDPSPAVKWSCSYCNDRFHSDPAWYGCGGNPNAVVCPRCYDEISQP